MKKLFIAIGVAVVTAITPFNLFAQQTIEEATDSIKHILMQAKAGDAEAQNEVGGWYYRGRHVKQNYEEALQWWAKSARQENIYAIGNMALCYQTGHGIEADSVKALALYGKSIEKGNSVLFDQNVKLADNGNLFSNVLVALCYQKGLGVEKDINKAVIFFARAAKNNSVDAQRELALAYLNGRKPAEAFKWFKVGADNGDLSCIFYCGKLLLEGMGVQQDKKGGANYLLEAANAGFPQAMYYVGSCYMDGNGLVRNPEQGIKWYQSAAGKEVGKAQWALANCYLHGKGVVVNYDQAMYWFAESVVKGHKRAFRRLVSDSIPDSPFIAYLRGMKAYAAKDFEEALKQFKAVEKAKNVEGKTMQGVILCNSAYEKYNLKKGIKLLSSAAESNPQAMYLLAGLYEAGKGVEKNMATSLSFFTRSAEAGYAPAECALADIYYEGRGTEQDYSMAVKWYSKADEQGQLNKNAAERYASCYENGWGGLEMDKSRAESIREKDYSNHIAGLLENI